MKATDALDRITVHVEENIFDLGSVSGSHPDRRQECCGWSSLNCTFKRRALNMSFYAPLTTFRRRRYLIAITVIATFTFFYLGIPQWELPHSLKVDGLGPLSRANIVQLTKMRKAKTAQDVDEIYGLLHLVVYKKTPLSRDVEATRPIDMAIYGGDKKLDWAKNVQRLNAEYPIVVFSKVCGFMAT